MAHRATRFRHAFQTERGIVCQGALLQIPPLLSLGSFQPPPMSGGSGPIAPVANTVTGLLQSRSPRLDGTPAMPQPGCSPTISHKLPLHSIGSPLTVRSAMIFSIGYGEVPGSTFQADPSIKHGTPSQTYFQERLMNGVYKPIVQTGWKAPGHIRKFLQPSKAMGIVMRHTGCIQPISHTPLQHLIGSRSVVHRVITSNGKSKGVATGTKFRQATGMEHGTP